MLEEMSESEVAELIEPRSRLIPWAVCFVEEVDWLNDIGAKLGRRLWSSSEL